MLKKLLEFWARLLALLDPALQRTRTTSLWRLHIPLFKRMDNSGSVWSVYGSWLVPNWSNATFLMAISGTWGFKLHDLLRERRSEFYFIDIGANFGVYSLIAERCENCSAIVAIEPNPVTFARLKDNIKANGCNKISAVNVGVGEEEKFKEIHYSESNIGKANFLGSGNLSKSVQMVNYKYFDEIQKKYPSKPVFIKIDVEGYKPVVLKELLKSDLSRNIECIFIEISPNFIGDDGVSKVKNYLHDLGLKEVWRSSGAHQYDAFYARQGI